jgi:chromate transporter
MSVLAQLALLFGHLSLLAVGGTNAVVPEIMRATIAHGWVTRGQFVQLFAISNAAPGPNVMISTVIGARVAGVPGALVATGAMVLPSGLLVILAGKGWETWRETRARRLLQAALLPVTAGLITAAAWLITSQAVSGMVTGAIAALCAYGSWQGKAHPLLLLIIGAAAGLLLL